MLKIAAGGLLVICGALLGRGRLTELKSRLALMLAVDDALALMAGEIVLCARPLPEAFESLSVRGPEGTREFFRALSRGCAEKTAAEVWAECCGGLDIGEGARAALMTLGAVLGCYEAQRQGAEIERVRLGIRTEAEGLRQLISSKGKSWPALGACFAGMAAMLLM